MLSNKKTNKKYTRRKYRNITELIETEKNILKYAGYTSEEAEICFWNVIDNYLKLARKEYSRKRKNETTKNKEEIETFIEILNEYLKLGNKKVKFKNMEISYSPKGITNLTRNVQIIFFYEDIIDKYDESNSIFSIKPSKNYVFFGKDGILVGKFF